MLRLVVLLAVCYLATAAVVHHDRQQSGETHQADPTEEELAELLSWQPMRRMQLEMTFTTWTVSLIIANRPALKYLVCT